VFMITGTGVHDPPDSAFTIHRIAQRKRRSLSSGISSMESIATGLSTWERLNRWIRRIVAPDRWLRDRLAEVKVQLPKIDFDALEVAVVGVSGACSENSTTVQSPC
jgi:hypothetical protein